MLTITQCMSWLCSIRHNQKYGDPYLLELGTKQGMQVSMFVWRVCLAAYVCKSLIMVSIIIFLMCTWSCFLIFALIKFFKILVFGKAKYRITKIDHNQQNIGCERYMEHQQIICIIKTICIFKTAPFNILLMDFGGRNSDKLCLVAG